MAVEGRSLGFGWRVYGLAVMAIGLICVALGVFDPGQPAPMTLPDRTLLAYGAAAVMIIAGAGTAWRPTAAWSSAVLAAYFGLVVVAWMDGAVVIAHPAEYGAYSGGGEQLAIAAGGLIVFAGKARINPVLSARLRRLGWKIFGVCAILFGGAHFIYLNLTVPLIPKWLPPSPTFWAYATGLAQIAAGLAILSGVRARLAAVLLTVMYAAFGVMVHAPMLLAHPADP